MPDKLQTHMNKIIKSDSVEIVKRWKERNPELFEQIKDGITTLEDFTMIVITQFVAFNNNQPIKT